MSNLKSKYIVGRDRHGRLSINVGRIRVSTCMSGHITTPMLRGRGFQIHQITPKSWKACYKLMPEYPLDKVCQLFLRYCTALGAEEGVVDCLATVIDVSKEDREMCMHNLFSTRAAQKGKGL